MRKLRSVIVLCLVAVMGISLFGCGAGSTETEPTQSATVKPTQPGQTEAPTATPKPEKTYDAAVHQLAVTDALMMSYVIETKNDKVIVIDGGGDSNSGTYNGKKYPKKEIDNLLKTLREITGEEVPTIDAWILTHCHSDHVNVFSHLINNMPGTVNVKKVYYNNPSEAYLYQYGGFDKNDSENTLEKFKRAVSKLSEDQIVTVQKGDSYTVDNVTFNIILTPDENNAGLISNAVNESSIVFDMKLGGQRVLFLGDLGPLSGARFIRAMKDTGSTDVDVVQLGHHGSQGLPMSYYWTIRPEACLWATPTWLWNNDNGDGYDTGPWETIDIHTFLTKKGVKHHYVMKDGYIKLEFPLDLS